MALPLLSSAPHLIHVGVNPSHAFFYHQTFKPLEVIDYSIFLFLLTTFSSVAQSCPTLCDPMNCSMAGLPVHHHSRSSPKLMCIELVMPSRHLILCCPLLLLPPIPPSIRVFSNESTHRMRWPKYWSLSFSIISSKEIPGLISFRMDWLDLLAVQGTLKSINSSVLSFLHSLTLTSIHDHWKKHSLDKTDLSRQSNVSAFEYAI